MTRNAEQRRDHHRQGFTLVEMLVVMAIIAILSAFVVESNARALAEAKRVRCLNNLRQMCLAAIDYALDNNDHFPPSQYTQNGVFYGWDFVVDPTVSGTTPAISPGTLWQATTDMRIQQCPSYKGLAQWMGEPYTGYNYNVSYVGGEPDFSGGGPGVVRTASLASIMRPDRCALFGDGEYGGGANKFMRAPWARPADGGYTGPDAHDQTFSGRSGGTQGFRHRGKTNVGFADGHAESFTKRYTDTYDFDEGNIAKGTGFLSADNSMYDPE